MTQADDPVTDKSREPVLLVLGQPTYYDSVGLRPYTNGLGWPQRDNSVDQVTISHVLEYLIGPARVVFMNQLWRVLVPGGRATIFLPYWSSPNAHADPYLEWPPFSEMSLQYLADAEFRQRNRIGYPEMKADFELRWGNSYEPEWHVRADNARTFAARHYTAVLTELYCVLTKRDRA